MNVSRLKDDDDNYGARAHAPWTECVQAATHHRPDISDFIQFNKPQKLEEILKAN